MSLYCVMVDIIKAYSYAKLQKSLGMKSSSKYCIKVNTNNCFSFLQGVIISLDMNDMFKN